MTKRKSNPWKGGRPSEMSEEKVKKLEEAFALDCSVWEACFYADITKTTYYNRLEKNPQLVDRFNALREKPVLMARQSVVKSLKENPEMALKYLERKRKKEFSLRTEIWQEEGEVFKMDVTVNYEAMTPKEIQEAIRKEMWDI